MKLFLWLATIAFAILSMSCWCVSHLVIQYLRDARADLAVPYFTRLALLPHTWLLFCPLPWVVVAAVLSLRRELSAGSGWVFAGSICIGTATVLSTVALAAVIAVLPFKL